MKQGPRLAVLASGFPRWVFGDQTMTSLRFLPDGRIQFIWNDRLQPFLALGNDTPSIDRASHVEPDSKGKWWADLEPVDGPTLGPFDFREDALQAEVDWLNDHHWFQPQMKQQQLKPV